VIADLHVHSRFSDGSYTVGECISRAAAAGLSHIALVDHDTTVGLPYAIEVGIRKGVCVVPGVEISAYDYEGTRCIHLLGYEFELPAVHIEAICEPVRRRRGAATHRQIEILADTGFPVTEAAVAAVATEGLTGEERRIRDNVWYKQHIMTLLMRRGRARSLYGEEYRRLFKGTGPCSFDIEYVDVYEAIEAIHDDGGVAVLAHPGQQQTFDLVRALAGKGLDGIEREHPDHDASARRIIRNLAKRHCMFMTGGSDDHGCFGPAPRIAEVRSPASGIAALSERTFSARVHSSISHRVLNEIE
jgi:phosphoribosyl 1,2-cyclic phosphate 1,2-diphosphodiesterase